MGMPFEGNCIHPRTKIKKNGSVFCLACHQIIKEGKSNEKENSQEASQENKET
jgi:uncharacterized Zn finger protein (UPF0148 family)